MSFPLVAWNCQIVQPRDQHISADPSENKSLEFFFSRFYPSKVTGIFSINHISALGELMNTGLIQLAVCMRNYHNSQYASLHEGVQIIFHDFHCHHLDTHGVRF